jgi:hypothetical protein
MSFCRQNDYEGSLMPKKLIGIASEIVQTQASLALMTADDIALSLRQVLAFLAFISE